MTHSLTVTARTALGSGASANLRTEKKIPGVVYGASHVATPITVDANEFQKIWEEAGESSIITISGVEGVSGALIQEVSLDPVYQTPLHVDLLAVDADKEITTTVPLTFIGTAPAEKELGGVLMKVMHDIEVRTLPKNLPHEITVDVSTLLTFEDAIRIKDITAPTGVQLLGEEEEVIDLVQMKKEEEEATIDVSAVVVEEKGKKEEGEA